MTLSARKNYYHKSPFLLGEDGRRYHYYVDESDLWLWQKYEGGSWSAAEAFPRKTGLLCACLDNGNRPNLVAWENGCFYHLVYEDEKFVERLFFREGSKMCRYPTLAGDNRGTLHLLYISLDEDSCRWWLLHHRYCDGKWEEPRAVDFGSGSSINYCSIDLDPGGNLHLVYSITEKGISSLYYRSYSPSSLNWNKALLIASEKDISYQTIHADANQNLHVLWSASSNSENRIKYRPMISCGWPKGGWKNELTISPALSSQPFPFFSYRNRSLYMCWLEEKTVTHFVYKNNNWEKCPLMHIEKPCLTRCIISASPLPPRQFWSPLSTDDPLPLIEACTESSVQEYDNYEPEFAQLRSYSENLINRAASLSAAKIRVEKNLEEKKKELTWLSQYNKKSIASLKKNLTEKDKEFAELESSLKEIIKSLKTKMDLYHKKWEAEKKSFLKEQQRLNNQVDKHKEERSQFNKILKEKEDTIGRLNARCSEQEILIKNLREENSVFSEKVKKNRWSISKFLGKLLHNKP